MTATNSARCIANTLQYEGGYTADRNDPGNWTGGKVGVGQLKGTKFGIAANTYGHLDIKNLTLDDAIEIYRRDWWPKVAGDQMPKGIDQLAYDGAVNSGQSRGLGWVASATGASNLKSASAIAEAATRYPDRVALAKRAVANRMAFLRGLRTFSRYGKGWTRRCAGMEALAVKMILESSPGSVPVKEELQRESTKANNAAKRNGTGAAGTLTGSGATVPQVEPSSLDGVMLALLVIGGIVALIVIAYFTYKWWINRERSRAYAELAAGTLLGGKVA